MDFHDEELSMLLTMMIKTLLYVKRARNFCEEARFNRT